LASLSKSRAEVEAENLVLRQQVNVLRRQMPKRSALKNIDHLLFVWHYRWFPSPGVPSFIMPHHTAHAVRAVSPGPVGIQFFGGTATPTCFRSQKPLQRKSIF
jgi:hypothetical protein